MFVPKNVEENLTANVLLSLYSSFIFSPDPWS